MYFHEIKIFFDVIKLNVEAAKRASPAPTPSTNSSTKESIGKKSLGFSAQTGGRRASNLARRAPPRFSENRPG